MHSDHDGRRKSWTDFDDTAPTVSAISARREYFAKCDGLHESRDGCAMNARPRGANTVTFYFEHCGRMTYMKQLAAETGIPLMTLYQRWHRGDRDGQLVRPYVPRIRRTA